MATGELPNWAEPLRTTCEAIATLLHPHVEVVLHDLETESIVAIWNPSSGRAPGDPSLLDDLPESWRERPVQGPYRGVLAGGREVGSVTALIRDARGRARGLLCINLDRTPLLDMATALARVGAPLEQRPPELFDRDWREQIALAVDERCHQLGRRPEALTRDERLAVVAELDRRSLFSTRNAAGHAARALGVSRATVYALLKEVRRERDAAGLPA